MIPLAARGKGIVLAALKRASWLVGNVMIGAVRFYQIFIGPLLPPSCRFRPSCSVYFIEAVKKYGPLRGGIKGMWRVCRCNPYNPGGDDPP